MNKQAKAELESCLRIVGFDQADASDIDKVNFAKNAITVLRNGVPDTRALHPTLADRFAKSLYDYLLSLDKPGAASHIRESYMASSLAFGRTISWEDLERRSVAFPGPQSMKEEPTMNTNTPPPRTIRQRITGALREGAKRAPVEVALEEGQKLLVKELLRGFRGTRGEKEGARKFLLWFFASPAGQVAIAAAISGGAPMVAGLIGKDGAAIQMVADEFAARAATITTKEGMKFAIGHLKPVLGLFSKLFDSFGDQTTEKSDAALPEPQPAGVIDFGVKRAEAAVPR
jgi:hypothetical protein